MTNPDPMRARHTVAGETTDSYRWVVLVVASLVGAVVSALRGPHQAFDDAETEAAPGRALAA